MCIRDRLALRARENTTMSAPYVANYYVRKLTGGCGEPPRASPLRARAPSTAADACAARPAREERDGGYVRIVRDTSVRPHAVRLGGGSPHTNSLLEGRAAFRGCDACENGATGRGAPAIM